MTRTERPGGRLATHRACYRRLLGPLHGVLAILLAVTALVTGADSGTMPVRAAAPFGWAYLFANQPTPAGGSYTPIMTRQFNSTGGANSTQAVATVTRTGIGAYTARLPNLGAAAGTVHVTAVGSLIAGDDTSGPGACKVASWGPSGTTQLVKVRCFDRTGAPADGAFTLTYVNLAEAPRPTAYLLADQPTPFGGSYTPLRAKQFNSSGSINTVRRTGVGAYTARLPNLAADTAHVQVTAYGTGSQRCQVAGWSTSGTDRLVDVRCFDSAGVAVDTRFTLTYVSGINLVGSPWRPDASGTASAYVFANRPSEPSYTPLRSYRFNSSGGTNRITRRSAGVYRVDFLGQDLAHGTVQVSVFGTQPARCKVASWTPSSGVQVRCFSRAGTLRDTAFTATVLASTGLAQRVAVPSYFRPVDDQGNLSPRWDRLRAGAPVVGLAVINPAGFEDPGYVKEEAYVHQVETSQAKGLIVLGYVDTDYGDEDLSPLEDVKKLVNKHYDMYGVDGIFFDQVFDKDDEARLAYYKALYDHVKSKSGKRVVVINPGRKTTESYIERADIIINFEGYYVAPIPDRPEDCPIDPTQCPQPSYAPGTANPWQLPDTGPDRRWEWDYPAERFWHLVHTTTAEADMRNAIRLSKQRNAGWIYVTDDALPNRWDRLPGESTNSTTYWGAERTAAASP